MNKSLALKKKLSLFLSLSICFSVFLYLIYFLINGDRGLIAYFKIKNQKIFYEEQLTNLKNENSMLMDKVKRLQPNTIDLDYLDEQFRDKSGYLKNNEIVVYLD